MIVSTSLSEIRALFLSWRGAILATCNNQLPLITSNRAVQSRYRSHSETTILVFQGDQISGDIDYRSKCLYWFIMIIRWFTATQMKCSDRFGISRRRCSWCSSIAWPDCTPHKTHYGGVTWKPKMICLNGDRLTEYIQKQHKYMRDAEFGRKIVFKIENEIEQQSQWNPKVLGTLIVLRGGELSCRQTENWVNLF